MRRARSAVRCIRRVGRKRAQTRPDRKPSRAGERADSAAEEETTPARLARAPSPFGRAAGPEEQEFGGGGAGVTAHARSVPGLVASSGSATQVHACALLSGRALAGVWVGRRRAMGLPALLLLALCAAGARGLYFHIGETEKRCFIEEIPDETMVIGQAGRGWTGPCLSPHPVGLPTLALPRRRQALPGE